MNILIDNAQVLPMTAAPGDDPGYFRGSVGIADGRIVFASADETDVQRFERRFGADLRRMDARGMFLLPGLVNLHNHAAMTLLRGYADDMALMPWLEEKIWPFEARIDGEDIYRGARLGIAEMLLGGTTTFVDMYWHADRVAEAARRSGIRAIVCPAFVDGCYDSFERTLVPLVEHGADSGLLSVRIGPHAPYTCSPRTIERSLELCERYGLGVHVHLSETLDEIDVVRQRYGKSPVEYLRDLGVFSFPTLAAHCVHVDEKDMEIMRREGVTVAHNPQSNMKLASGVAPVVDMLRRGIAVGIGTDGPSSNNDLDMWEEMRTASLLQKSATGDPRALPAYETLYMATAGGARALGMEDRIGSIAPGMRADLILVDPAGPHLRPCYDPAAALVYGGKASDVHTVIVDGEVLVAGRKLCREDLRETVRAVEERIEEILARTE